MKNGWIARLLLLLVLVGPGFAIKRTLRSWVNPGCGPVCDQRNLTFLYLRADGPNDTLHYVWDFSTGNPAVLLALTQPSTSLNISWPEFLERRPKSLWFTEEPAYTFGVVLNKIIEFDDKNDTGLMNTASHVKTNVLHPKNFRWERKTLSRTEEFIVLDMEGSSYNDTALNITRHGTVTLSLRGYCSMDHSEIMPHMLHTENSTQVDLVLDSLQTNKTFANSRFAIELLVVAGGDPNIPMFVDPKQSLDDEHTPGIFEVVEVRTPPYDTAGSRSSGGYLQWRPVSYTAPSRDVSDSTGTVQYPPVKASNRTVAVENTTLYTYYGDLVEGMLVQRIRVSFGTTGDGFYRKAEYATWTFLIGYGTPPDEQFSYLVIMIISIGLGLPLLILAAVGVYICCRRRSKRDGEVYLDR